MSKLDEAVESVKARVADVTRPSKMSRSEYKEFLGMLIEELQDELRGAHDEDGTKP